MPGNSKPITTARSGVFVSYARSDGEQFANLVCRRLEVERISFWMDRRGMEGGNDWWLQIAEMLERVEFLALVVTPDALASDTVRKEWRYARQQGVCVYPIKATPDLDLDSLPRWIRSLHFYDLGTVENGLDGPEWRKFVNYLDTRCQAKRVPFMVGDLPKDFVARPGEFDQLLKLLCDERREEPLAITAALKGAGGYGKTTLAKALCHDKRIQDVFDDGMLWVTLGENPGDLTGKVEDLIVTLGDQRPGFTALDAAVNRLKELLADRDVLIVIDDVWDRAHVNPFIQGGQRCGRLITTRNFETLPADARRVDVDAMQQQEATALLSAGLDQYDGLERDLGDLATRLGEWPLLLRLVNSALRNRIENDKRSPRDAVTWINKALEKRGVTYFDAQNSKARDQAVARTIEVSLDLLSATDRERYGELAIFPEDIEIPLATLEKLWAKTGEFDEFDTEDLCSRLNSFSLLWSYDANLRRIRLHDVVRKFLIERQGDKLPSIHAQLLDAHRPPCWAEMPTDEPYLWDHLAYHMVEAGRGDELVATVKDWRYLVSKTLMRKSLAVEADLLAAEKVAANDDALQLLRRNFVNTGHLLNRCEKREDIEATLFSRLQHLDGLKPLTTDLGQYLKRPCIIPVSQLPDLPHPALMRTLSGHEDWILGCAVSKDGATIVSACDDQTLKVWDGRTGAERFMLSGHEGGVFGCAVSTDGTMIVSASSDKTLKVWDGRSGAERFTLRGHANLVRGCAVSADGATIVSASDDETLKVWDGRSGSERFTLRGHVDGVSDCAVSADGATIVSASSDGTLKVWDGSSGTERLTLSGHGGAVRGCAVSTDGMMIVSASSDNTLKVWDRSGAERFTLSGHVRQVRSCAVSMDGTTIVSASEDGTLKVWEGESGTERLALSGHSGGVFDCAVSGDGATIVSASNDKTLKLWDGRSGSERLTLSGYADWARGCAVSADGGIIVSASFDETRVWDGRSGAQRLTLSGHIGVVTDCAVSADGETIVSASADRTLRVWDRWSGAGGLILRGHASMVNSCAISADGATIISASDKLLKVWDGRKRAERFTLRSKDMVSGCAMSADGSTIVSASYKTLQVWDGRNGAERFTLSGHTHWVKGCAVSADGAMIISASSDGTLKVWDGRSGAERLTLSGHADWVRGCAVSADGATIISVSDDQTLRVWDVLTRKCLSTLHVDGPLQSCACSADSEVIVATGHCGVYFLRLVR